MMGNRWQVALVQPSPAATHKSVCCPLTPARGTTSPPLTKRKQAMTTNGNRNMNIEFDFKLESIELDLKGWLKTLFRQNIIRPMTKIAKYDKRKVDDRVTPATRRRYSAG